MCDRTQFNRIRRNLLSGFNLIFSEISTYLKDKILIADSFPLEVCMRGEETDLFRFALTTVEGAIMIFAITPANIDDRLALRDM